MPRAFRLALGSLAVAFGVLALKLAAWAMTGSLALMSDALESVVNVATAIAVLIALRVAAIPADAEHPYGHHKAEFFSAVIEGVLIAVAALIILHQAWSDFSNPRAVTLSTAGLSVNALASVINGVWAAVLIRAGTRDRSPALVADGKHLAADVVSSVTVLAGLVLVLLTGIKWIDPVLAVLVALNILWSGWTVIRQSVSGLMDESVNEADLTRVREIIARAGEGAHEAHDLRTRHAGRVTFIDFHLVVPGEMSVNDAHAVCDRIEAALKEELADARITIHVEPEYKAKHSGIVVVS